MPQIVNGIGTKAQFVDKGIACYTAFFHGSPKRFIADHKHPTLHQDKHIIFCKSALEHTQIIDYTIKYETVNGGCLDEVVGKERFAPRLSEL